MYEINHIIGEIMLMEMRDDIVLQRVNSSDIDSVGYSDAKNIMLVRFKTGAFYEYHGISPEVYTALMSSQSIGKYFTSKIRGRYPYKEVKLSDEQQEY